MGVTVKVGLFEVLIPQKNMPKDFIYDQQEQKFICKTDSSKVIGMDSKIRFRVQNISWRQEGKKMIVS